MLKGGTYRLSIDNPWETIYKNEVNWNILVTFGTKIKRDSVIFFKERITEKSNLSKMDANLFENRETFL